MIPGSGSVIFLLFVLVTVPIISNKFLEVYRLTQEKSTNVRFLFVLFFYHYYSIYYHAALIYSSRIKSISITFDTSLNMISLRKRKETATLKSQSRHFIRACQMTAVRRLFSFAVVRQIIISYF